MKRLVALASPLAIGCSFQGATPTGSETSDGAPGADADPIGLDASIDAVPLSGLLYAGFETTLYSIDFDARNASFIGDLNVDEAPLPSLGFAIRNETTGLAIDFGSPKAIYSVDLMTGNATQMSELTLDREYFGLGRSPGDSVLAAPALWASATDDNLYRIEPSTGTVTAIGPHGGDFRISGDITWVRNVGLFGTFDGTGCNDCLCRINHVTGAVTVIAEVRDELWGLASVNGRLFALDSAGDISELNPTTADVMATFSTGVGFSMAGP